MVRLVLVADDVKSYPCSYIQAAAAAAEMNDDGLYFFFPSVKKLLLLGSPFSDDAGKVCARVGEVGSVPVAALMRPIQVFISFWK